MEPFEKNEIAAIEKKEESSESLEIIEDEKSFKKFYINISNAKKAEPLMRHLIQSNKDWVETLSSDRYDMYVLSHTAKEDEVRKILTKKAHRIINRYPPCIKDLARKDNFQAMMSVASDSEYADEYDFVPRTFIFP